MVLRSSFAGESADAAAASTSGTLATPHFVLLQHGINGSPQDLGVLRRFLEGSTSTDAAPFSDMGSNRFVIWDTAVNAGFNSYKGTVLCTDALMVELVPALDRFIVESQATISAAAPSAAKPRFSIVGHSFGGVLIREIAFRVHQRYRDALSFCSFVSAAAPHLGVRMASPVVSKGGAVLGHAFSQTIHELCLNDAKLVVAAHPPPGGAAAAAAAVPIFSGQLASRLVDSEHIAALAAFDTRLLVANLTNDHLVPFQTASLMVDAQYDHLKRLVDNADRVTAHTLPPRRLPKFSSDAEARACIGEAHWGTAEGAITYALRSKLDFELLPVAVSSRFMRSHSAVVSKWRPFQTTGMDDVSNYVAQYIAHHGSTTGPMPPRAVVPHATFREHVTTPNGGGSEEEGEGPMLAEQETSNTTSSQPQTPSPVASRAC